jgi:hypothetical protein
MGQPALLFWKKNKSTIGYFGTFFRPCIPGNVAQHLMERDAFGV